MQVAVVLGKKLGKVVVPFTSRPPVPYVLRTSGGGCLEASRKRWRLPGKLAVVMPAQVHEIGESELAVSEPLRIPVLKLMADIGDTCKSGC
jgi:hypothetical protein